ncbi:MAG: hypothetical protein HOO06_04680 [Bdellovibrionaceae bacterium]|jgi:hypothetical protein|nr:hypothetical protein [Pseudobdellovibrionaceae bacterium]
MGVKNIIVSAQFGTGRTVSHGMWSLGTTHPPNFTQGIISQLASQTNVNIFASDDFRSFATGIYFGDNYLNINHDGLPNYLDESSYPIKDLMKEGIVYMTLPNIN